MERNISKTKFKAFVFQVTQEWCYILRVHFNGKEYFEN